MNYEKREYQLNISRSCLFTNVLVCLPTGLGKTFIASVVIYNFYRWFPRSKIIFMVNFLLLSFTQYVSIVNFYFQAPSRPLVNQQIDACYNVVGIPSSETIELTGKCAKEKRMEYWSSKRVFFVTPQVMQNDIKDPSFPINSIKLIVVDEAHKAKGKFAYCEVIEKIHEVNKKFRVLALSATPGKQDDVIQIIRNLLISKIEVRTENSIDVMKYTFSKIIDIVSVPLGSDLKSIRDRYDQIVHPYLRKLIDFKVISGSNFSKGWLIIQHNKFRQQSHPQKAEITKIFSCCISLLYSLELLERHGIQIFLKSFNDDDNVTKMKYFVAQDKDLKEFLIALNKKYKDSNPFALNVHSLPNGEIPSIGDKKLVFGHPKFDILKSKISEYFNNGGTKAIVFCEFRDTVAMVFIQLLQLRPVVQPRMLIGQGGAVSQKDQLTTMKDFRANKVNVLVTTSVCEEGIDVGEVDLVLCFDISSKNPTRFVQRIGRTGRRRKGKVIILASEGKELQVVGNVVGSKEKLNKSILNNKEISNNLFKNSPRLVPMCFQPKCVETKFNIPEAETETKPSKKVKNTDVRKVIKPSTTIKSHFKPTQKLAEDAIETNINPSTEVQELESETHLDSTPSLLNYREPVEILKKFHEEMEKLSNTVVANKALKEHFQWSSEKDWKVIENIEEVFYNTSLSKDELIDMKSSAKSSAEFDLNCAMILEDSLSSENSCEIAPTATEERNQSVFERTPKKEQKLFESQENRFIKLESRYGNQFSFGEQLHIPFNSPVFTPMNTLNNRTKLSPLGSTHHKKPRSCKKKTPIKNSPLIKAFEKQRNLSCSTPSASKAEIFLQSPLNKQKFPQTASTSVKSSKSNESIDVCKYFGITSIDEIFDDLDTDSDKEEKKKNESHNVTPTTCENSIAQLLERDNDLFLNVEIDDEIVESSLVEETASTKSSNNVEEGKHEEKFEFNIDEIFGDESFSSTELEKNIDGLPSDMSQLTQEYNFEDVFENKKENVSPADKQSPVKENELIVHSMTNISLDAPLKSQLSRPRPNIAKLNVLKNLNVVSPPSSNVSNQSPVTTSRSIFTTPVQSLPASTTSQTKFLIPSPHVSSPLSSRKMTIPKQIKPKQFADAISNARNSLFQLPVSKRTGKMPKRNYFWDAQAAVDGSDSSDEDEDEDDMMNSFIDNSTNDASIADGTQIDMRLKYIQSLRSPSARLNRNFKIPIPAPQPDINVFSQMPNEDDDWEVGSFIVEDVEEANASEDEPDELEIAEMILKQKRKRHRQMKNGTKRRKIIRMLESSDEEELQELRKQLNSNPD